MAGMSFVVEARDGRARAGRLTTPHGDVETPVFFVIGQGEVFRRAQIRLVQFGGQR